MTTTLLAFLLLGAAPNVPADSYRQDVQRLCDAQQLSGIQPSETARWAAWAQPKTNEAKNLVASIAAEKEPGVRSTLLGAEAKKLNLQSCMLADAWSAQAHPLLFPTARQAPDARLPKEIRSVILQHEGEVRACYEGPLAAHPTLGGDMTLGLALDSKGRVATARVERSELQSPQVEGCMVSAAKQWRFGKTAQATRIQVPFTFKPPEGAAAASP